MNELAALAFALVGIHVGAHRVLPVGYAPAWSPDGERIAFVTQGDLWVADADGTHRGALVDGRRPAGLVAERPAPRVHARGSVWTIRADGARRAPARRRARTRRGRPTASGIAFDRDDRDRDACAGTAAACRTAGTGSDPAYAPDGRLAVVSRRTRSSPAREPSARAPSPRGRPTGSTSPTCAAGRSTSTARPVHRGAAACVAAAPPRVRELLPDFDQRAPTGLPIARRPGPLAARASPRSSTTSASGREHRRGRPPARREANDRHAARAARERQEPHLPRRRADSGTRTHRRTITGT